MGAENVDSIEEFCHQASMLSALILTNGNEDKLANTLGSLIPGITAGVLANGLVLDCSSSSATAKISDEVGCDYVVTSDAGLRAAIAFASSCKEDWLLCISSNYVLDANWHVDVGRFLEKKSGQPQAMAVLPVKGPASYFAGKIGMYPFGAGFVVRKSDIPKLRQIRSWYRCGSGMKVHQMRCRSFQQIES